jgi:hypothetical protein
MKCNLCGGEYFVSSPDYGRGAEMAHYCSRTGSRRVARATAPEDIKKAAATKSLSLSNAGLPPRELKDTGEATTPAPPPDEEVSDE